MQSYQLHIVSEQLFRRHPYLQPPFKARYDSTEVYKAVFDRAIPKLIEILLTQDLPANRYASALITLNQIASDETEKSNMIDKELVGIASAFCHCKHVTIRRQATLLLGLLCSSTTGLKQLRQEAFDAFKTLLFDEQLEVRNAVSWSLCRVTLSRLGTDILNQQLITPKIIQSFLKYSQKNDPKEEYYIIYLLHLFKHLLVYDQGIKFCLNTGLTKRLNSLTATTVYSQIGNNTIHELSLNIICNLAMNNDTKVQCIQQHVIQSAQKFLQSKNKGEVAHAITVIMFSSIHLEGKKQCIYNADKSINRNIVVKLIKLLDSQIIDDVAKNDVKETLKIIAQQGDAFLTIADHMSRQTSMNHIEDIFGPRIIVPLALLLPKTKQIADPPTLPSNKINEYKSYAKTINHMLKKFPQALQLALQQCVDLCTKLIVFICYRGDKILQDGIGQSLLKLAQTHPYSLKLIQDFVKEYGDIHHKISKTTISAQIKHFDKLSKLVFEQSK